MGASKGLILGLILLLAIPFHEAEAAQGKTPSPSKTGSAKRDRSEESKYLREVAQTGRALRETLEDLRGVYERDLKKQKEQVETLRELLGREMISRLELEQGEERVGLAESKVKEVEQRIAEADIAITEALAEEQLMKQAPPSVGKSIETAEVIHYNGGAHWTLANVPDIEAFFTGRFGRALPISALGQTAVHDRMRFDHRSAIDVAVHPDSAEGRGLITYLRSRSIPFIAFRGRISGAATGAHIHIGKPSLRNGVCCKPQSYGDGYK